MRGAARTRSAGAAVASAVLAALLSATGGCATLQQMMALRNVEFSIERVSQARLAGIAIDSMRSYRDLSPLQIAQIGLALTRREMPLSFTLHLSALNPAGNSVTARLVQMDWTALLENREVLSGSIDREYQFAPGVATDVPIAVSLDLADFFERNVQDMVELALAVANAGGAPKQVSLRATPVIQTSLGPIRYPGPITIVSRTVGGG
jgi:hypothetical protein